MRLVPFALMPSSPHSPLLAAYNLWSHADFTACLAELERLRTSLAGVELAEATLLRARTLLRLDRAADAVDALDVDSSLLEDDDVRCAVEALRGFALVSAGRCDEGMRSLHETLARATASRVDASVRLEAVYHMAFAYWTMGDYDRAEVEASRATVPGVEGIMSRATALRGWIRIGRSQYAQALPFFREARRAFTSVSRDAAFEASVVHALATYEWQLLEYDGEPHYYAEELPRVHGPSLDTYRLLVGIADAWRAALAGDEYRAVAFAAQTEANDVPAHWRIFGLATRAGIARSFGHEHFARATADVGFTIASGTDWTDSPGESRMALLYAAERLAGHDVERARALLGAYARITTEVDPRYSRGAHAFHRATEHHARGVVALAASEPSAHGHLLDAHELFTAVGFSWRAAASQLVLARENSAVARRAYRCARTFVLERFPRSYLARELHDHAFEMPAPAGEPLTPTHVAIIRALCAGKSKRQIAEERRTALGTVRNQVKQILQRTDLHSVDELRRRYGRTSA
jgi:DNA-binding NarL/FixJ family response regulator